MNRNISEMFEGFELEPEVTSTVTFDPERVRQATLRRIHRSNTAAVTRRKIWRTALLAAVIASFLSVTAFAAAYYHMYYRLAEPGEKQVYEGAAYDYRTEDWGPKTEITYEASMILRFDARPDGTRMYMRADWLPSEPAETSSLYDELLSQAVRELDLRDYVGVEITPEIEAKAAELAEGNWASVEEAKEMHMYESLLLQAMEELGLSIPYGDERYVPPELEEKIRELAAAWGTTAREAKDWYSRYSGADGHTVSYLVEISDPSQVYDQDFLVGHQGSSVTVVSEMDAEDWQELILTVDNTEAYGEDSLFRYVNHIFRFNKAAGYLIHISGTLDLDTLSQIAGSIRVWDSGIETHYEPGGGKAASLDVALG